MILLIFISIYILYQNNTKPSTPFPLPILGHLHLITKKPYHRTLTKLAEQYGPVILLRYGFRKVLVVSSPSAVEELFTRNDIAFANRPHLIAGKHLGYNYTSLVWSSYGDHWRNLRRFTALEIFSSYHLQLDSLVRSEEMWSLVLQLFGDSNFKEFHEVELKTKFFELMLNILMRMIAGKRYYGENVMDLDEAKKFRHIVKETFYLIGIPNLSDYLPFLRWFDLQGLEKRMVISSQERDLFIQKLIDDCRERRDSSSKDGHEKKTMIDVLLWQQEADPEYYTDDIIKGLIATMLSAGTDTSAVTMEWAMSLLLNHSEVLKKAREEIDLQVGEERLFQESDLHNLPYLRKIIKETLRLYPAGAIVTHESSKACTVGGLRVPSGTMLQLNLWALHRDPNVWAEPLKFNPERFQGDNEGFDLIPFGSGRRKCPGEGLAMRVVGLALGSLIQCFEWKRVGEELVDMTEGGGVTLPRVNPLVVMCKPRPIMQHILTQFRNQ
ncbi:hypothetical protein AQUCO_04200018v1 [Aquilegia coerulea]|uniref:Cytochrome P450 n=1 Tax=Aquilegia coerulea TaxID=218851 RepID=A0A2G5CNW7_AQUCA|nr:hypothetical protein AQUCO_04200018v1 [Aquilegia coerulea]